MEGYVAIQAGDENALDPRGLHYAEPSITVGLLPRSSTTHLRAYNDIFDRGMHKVRTGSGSDRVRCAT